MKAETAMQSWDEIPSVALLFICIGILHKHGKLNSSTNFKN